MRRFANTIFLAGLTLLLQSGASAQGTPRKVGMLAKAAVAKATAEARKWRSDSYLFQIDAANVPDGGIQMWNYGYYSPGATGKKCFHANVAPTGESGGVAATCAFDPEQKLPEFTVDSDKAIEAARKAGLAKPTLRVTLRMSPVRNMGERPLWLISEGAARGDKQLHIDALTGEVRSQTKIP